MKVFDLKSVKVNDFKKAEELSIVVCDSSGKIVGKMVPIGEWALTDFALIESFTAWRDKFMRFFLTHFSASLERTKNYLENQSIYEDDKILFAIFLPDGKLMGHIGLTNFTSEKVELDNMIRGESGGHPQLMLLSEGILLDWVFDTLLVKKVEARVLSNNLSALMLHRLFGFKVVNTRPLRKEVTGSSSRLIPCKKDDRTEEYTLTFLELIQSEYLSVKQQGIEFKR